MTKEKEVDVDSKRFYSLSEIVSERIIPGIDTVPKASRLVRNDLLFNKILQAQIIATPGGHVSYKVRGSNIIKYLTETDAWRKK